MTAYAYHGEWVYCVVYEAWHEDLDWVEGVQVYSNYDYAAGLLESMENDAENYRNPRMLRAALMTS